MTLEINIFLFDLIYQIKTNVIQLLQVEVECWQFVATLLILLVLKKFTKNIIIGPA